MTERVRIDTSGTYPFKVTAQGVDLSGAQFNDLLFDANARPLRLYDAGYVEVFRTSGSIFPDVVLIKDLFRVPAGQFPLFSTMWKHDDGSNVNSPYPRTCGTCGAAIDQYTQLWSVNRVGNNFSFTGPIYCNWAVMRNHM